MIQGHIRLDTCLKEPIYQLTVEIQSFLVNTAGTIWQNSRPGDREAVCLQADFLHQLKIVLPELIMVGADITHITIIDLTGCMTKSIPDRFTFAVYIPTPFDLI